VLYFESDYMEGAHPAVLQKILETNLEKTSGYGADPYCERAQQKIREACSCPGAEVYFLVGGTQTNATVIDALLPCGEGVLAVETGHIQEHEAGAVEASGHKILTLPHKDGKLQPGVLSDYLASFDGDANNAHRVAPGMVYLSHPTEYGTLYTQAELEELHTICARRSMPLYVDGARMGYGLAAQGTDVTLPVLAQTCDAFTIGGTKAGALFGEAAVFPRPGRVRRFFSCMKRHGAVLAKGRLLGIQFDALFTDGLYFAISAHADAMAEKMEAGFRAKGYAMYLPTRTNQKFVVMGKREISRLKAHVRFGFWEGYDAGHDVVRFVTSWATGEEDVDALIALL